MKKILLLLTSFGLVGACQETPIDPEFVPCASFLQSFAPANGDTVTTTEGVRYIDIETGTGTPATWGHVAAVHYSGYFISGSGFDSSCTGIGSPLLFQLGDERYLHGFQYGLIGMQTTGVRRVILPLELGYIGDTEQRIFDIELVNLLN